MRDPKPMPNLSVSEVGVAWASGLLEGEGSFVIHKTGAHVSCTSTDEDVIRTLRSLLGVGSIGGPYDRSPNKAEWRWGVYARNEVRAVLAVVRPWLGERRTTQIDKVLAHLDSTERDEPECGTYRMYQRGCRCQPCTKANTERAREGRRRRKEQDRS